MPENLTRRPYCAKEKAFASTTSAGEARELAAKLAEFPEFAWLGEELAAIPRFRLLAAQSEVQLHGEEPCGSHVARTLGISEQDARERVLVADVQRRARRAVGDGPPGKPLAERKKYVAVKKLLEFFARLVAPSPRLPDGTKVSPAAAELLARVGVADAAGARDGLEAHPRAKPRPVRKLDSARRERVEAELGALERGEFGPAESTKALPDHLSEATRRNRRRAADARAQYEEQLRYERQQRQERVAGQAGGRFNNPVGVKRLPLHEGRKARKVAWDRHESLRFLLGLPHSIRVQLFEAATRGGLRGRFSEQARLLYAFFAFLWWQAEAPRPTMRRAGFDRAVEGLCREALAVAFVPNSWTSAPYHANTISALAAALEEVGLLAREAPNGQKDVYTGTTGWALYVYRLRNAEQLGELLKALEELTAPTAAELEPVPAPGAGTAPS